MKFQDALRVYLKYAPNALAIERSWEIDLISRSTLSRPILDLGCGDGIFAKVLSAEPFEFGLDPNEKELKRAASFGVYKKLIKSSGDAIPLEDESISTVISNSTLEHIRNLDSVIKEIHRVLKPGGSLIVTLPTNNFDHFTAASLLLSRLGMQKVALSYRKAFNNFWAHYNFMSAEEWKNYFELRGFTVRKSQGYGTKFSCVLNEITVPFSFVGFINKKIANRWTIFESAKMIYSIPIRYVFGALNSRFEVTPPDSGLIFLELAKR